MSTKVNIQKKELICFESVSSEKWLYLSDNSLLLKVNDTCAVLFTNTMRMSRVLAVTEITKFLYDKHILYVGDAVIEFHPDM